MKTKMLYNTSVNYIVRNNKTQQDGTLFHILLNTTKDDGQKLFTGVEQSKTDRLFYHVTFIFLTFFKR